MKKHFYFRAIFLSLVMVCHTSYSAQRFFLCGPDEDGCPPNDIQYCNCIPYNEVHATKPYCLDFNKMICEPLVTVKNCEQDMIFEDQGKCLATIFQSEPEPPCTVTTKTFCMQHHAAMCNANGDPRSCR